VLHGVSTFGTKIALYKYHQATNVLEPRRITHGTETLTVTAPREWWSCDILEDEGARKLRDVEDVKAMCADFER